MKKNKKNKSKRRADVRRGTKRGRRAKYTATEKSARHSKLLEARKKEKTEQEDRIRRLLNKEINPSAF